MERTTSITRGRAALGTGVLAAVASLCFAGCRGLSNAEQAERIRGLPKNEPLRALELQRGTLRVEDPERGERELEFVWTHVPARDPAASATRTPVVLVHGTPGTLSNWVEVALGGDGFDGLSAQRDVYLLEVVGHGYAPGSLAPYTFQRCADFVAAALRALGLERVHLVGQSYGGEFAWRAALDAPERIRGLVLVDSAGLPRREGDWLSEEVVMRENSLAGLGWLLNSADRVRGALEPHFRAIPPDRVEEFTLSCDSRADWGAMIDLVRDENGGRAAELPRLAAPTLLVWGAQDVAYDPEHYAARFAALIPDARLVTLPEAGHYPHEERPAAFVETLTAFFEELEGRRP